MVLDYSSSCIFYTHSCQFNLHNLFLPIPSATTLIFPGPGLAKWSPSFHLCSLHPFPLSAFTEIFLMKYIRSRHAPGYHPLKASHGIKKKKPKPSTIVKKPHRILFPPTPSIPVHTTGLLTPGSIHDGLLSDP